MLKLMEVEDMICVLNYYRVNINWFYKKIIQQFFDLINYNFPMM